MLPAEKLNGENNGVKQENSKSDEQDNGLINQEDMEKLELEEQTSSETEVFDLSRKHPVSDEASHQHPNQSNPTKLYWPAEILTEILSGLPVNLSCDSSKFVNGKLYWATSIDIKSGWSITFFHLRNEKWKKFTKYHLSLSANNNKDYTNHRVMLRIAQPEVNLKERPIMEETNLDYHMKNSGIACVIEGSVNGFICLVNEVMELFLWNPAIRKYKKLPDFRTKMKDDGQCRGAEILRMDQGNPDALPAIPHAEQAMGDLDLALRLGPLSPTKEALERELLTFLSFFGNREVRRDVLEGTIRKLDLNSASPEKLFFEDPTTYAGTFQQTDCCSHSVEGFIESFKRVGERGRMSIG
ncbi:putative organic cation/carnitine transporter 4-like [Capsicum annuum]|nr:putative organic cation/carnitine transporter 4-like [Capsicum annuum]